MNQNPIDQINNPDQIPIESDPKTKPNISTNILSEEILFNGLSAQQIIDYYTRPIFIDSKKIQ